MLNVLLGALLSFALVCIVSPYMIRTLARRKAGQPILGYVDNHKSKEGTPTMGGIAVIAAVCVSTLCLMRGEHQMALVAAAVFFGYGAIGFLDDFIKVHYRRNRGLAAYQKIIAQLGLAVILAVYCYRSPLIGTSLSVPVTGGGVDFGWGVIPFVIVVMIAVTNCVNLTDGLDGLASTTTVCYLVVYLGMLVYGVVRMNEAGLAPDLVGEYRNLCLFGAAMLGAILAFLLFNAHPAKVFMGDTGSLAIGGGLGVLAVCTRTEFLIPILGIMYVLSGISVIMQVAWYKLTHRRIFLMAPFHHHLERKGWSETRISVLYGAVTLVVGCALIYATILCGGFRYGF